MNLGLLPLTSQGLRVGFNGDFTLGASVDVPYNPLTLIIGKNNQVQPYADNSIVLGNNNTIQSNALCLNPNNTVIGQNCIIGRNTLGGLGNSGGNVVIGRNASVGTLNTSNGLVGNNVAIGPGASATGTNGVAIGFGATTGGGMAFGTNSQAAAGCFAVSAVVNGSASIGILAANSSAYAMTIQGGAVSRGYGDFHYGSAVPQPSTQWGVITVYNTTTDATQTELFTWPTLLGRSVLPNNSVMTFFGTLTARNTSNNDAAVWYTQGVITRGANAASTAILGTPTSTQLGVSAGAAAWSYVLDADTSNGSIRFRVTGAAATNIRWYVSLNTSEVA